MSSVEAVAQKLGISPEQVREVLAFEARGTWTTTINGIITHADGSRHWSSATCEQCS